MGAGMGQFQLRKMAHRVAEGDDIEVQAARLVRDEPGAAAELAFERLQKREQGIPEGLRRGAE